MYFYFLTPLLTFHSMMHSGGLSWKFHRIRLARRRTYIDGSRLKEIIPRHYLVKELWTLTPPRLVFDEIISFSSETMLIRARKRVVLADYLVRPRATESESGLNFW